jgi:hypothetical protein
MTGGALACVCDAQEVSTVWRGYVPLWDEFGIRCVALIGHRYFDLAANVGHLEPVKVTKTKRQGCPIRVEARGWTSIKPPVSANDAKPQDIRPWLLRLWRDAALEKWLKDNPAAPVVTTDKPAAKPEKSPAVPPAVRARQEQIAGLDLPPLIGEALGHLPGANGKKRH